MAINVLQNEAIISLNSELEPVIDDQEEGDDITPEVAAIELTLRSNSCGERLDKVLAKLVPQYSRSRIQQWIEAGFVTVDGQTSRIKMTMLGDESIVIYPQAAPDEGAYSRLPSYRTRGPRGYSGRGTAR